MIKLSLLTAKLSTIAVITIVKSIFKRKIIVVDFVNDVFNEANYQIYQLK